MSKLASPSLRQVAAAAGVSHVTVSRALRDDPSIPPKTTRRLKRLAERMGYRPNPLVKALLSQVRTRRPHREHTVIAYVNTWWPRPAWETCNTKTAQFRGASERANELGFRLENFWMHEPRMNAARLAQILKARGIRGVLVGPLQNQSEVIDFPWHEFAVAALGYSLHRPGVSRACHAHFRGMYRAMDELISRGYRRIGYVTSRDQEERVTSLWGAAFRFHQHRLTARNRIEPLVFDGEADCAGLRRWVEATKPDAIVNAIPRTYEFLTELRLLPATGLGFVHLDLPIHLKQANVTGIDQLSDIVGAGAMELVASQLYTNTYGIPTHPVTHIVEGAWVEGASLRMGELEV